MEIHTNSANNTWCRRKHEELNPSCTICVMLVLRLVYISFWVGVKTYLAIGYKMCSYQMKVSSKETNQVLRLYRWKNSVLLIPRVTSMYIMILQSKQTEVVYSKRCYWINFSWACEITESHLQYMGYYHLLLMLTRVYTLKEPKPLWLLPRALPDNASKLAQFFVHALSCYEYTCIK